jgi:hypothetical protein
MEVGSPNGPQNSLGEPISNEAILDVASNGNSLTCAFATDFPQQNIRFDRVRS